MRVTLGAAAAHRWRFLGVDMGFVPRPAAVALSLLTPVWSEVDREHRADFFLPDDALPDGAEWTLFEREADGGFVACVPAGWEVTARASDGQHSLEELLAGGVATVGPDGTARIPITPDLRLLVGGGGSVFLAQTAHCCSWRPWLCSCWWATSTRRRGP
ncbi:MAG: hypothetical protein R3F59_06265 [Myxococcota bacterium]